MDPLALQLAAPPRPVSPPAPRPAVALAIAFASAVERRLTRLAPAFVRRVRALAA